MKSYMVIGLGLFGGELARKLCALGCALGLFLVLHAVDGQGSVGCLRGAGVVGNGVVSHLFRACKCCCLIALHEIEHGKLTVGVGKSVVIVQQIVLAKEQ